MINYAELRNDVTEAWFQHGRSRFQAGIWSAGFPSVHYLAQFWENMRIEQVLLV